MLKRISWRIQPVEQIRKRKQRKKDMQERRKQFAEFVAKEERKWEEKKKSTEYTKETDS